MIRYSNEEFYIRMRVKSNGGYYQPEPFVNMIDNGNVNHLAWIAFGREFTINAVPGQTTESLQVRKQNFVDSIY